MYVWLTHKPSKIENGYLLISKNANYIKVFSISSLLSRKGNILASPSATPSILLFLEKLHTGLIFHPLFLRPSKKVRFN